MNYARTYKMLLWVTVVLTVLAYLTLLGWAGRVISSWGQPFSLAFIPWLPVLLLALTAINCFIRKRFFAWRIPSESTEE